MSPNQVYLRTQRGLSEIVSAAVATRVLNKALADAGIGTSAVRATQMRGLLLGPLLDELDMILPRGGLTRQLEALAGSLDDVSVAPAPLSAEPRTAPAQPVDHDPSAVSVAATVRPRPAGVVTGVRTTIGSGGPIAAQLLQQAVLGLAVLDNVTLVAAVRADGRVEYSRGSGDVAGLARLGMLALSLLTRSGPLRLYFIASERSSLLLFPWAGDALLLVGTPELNVGAAVVTFNDIIRSKEEP